MKRTERSWMYNRLEGRRLKTEFINGVSHFIEFAKEQPACFKDVEKIRCPCLKCDNKRFQDVDDVREHLYKKGFCKNYFQWICQGEDFNNSQSVERSYSCKSSKTRNMNVVAFGGHENLNHGEAIEVEEEPNGEAKKFFDLLKAANNPLYEGRNMTVLEMAAKLTNLKCKYNLPQKCVDGFASLFSEVVPDNNLMSRTFDGTKKVLQGLQLPHEKIHTCPNGCILFWKDDSHLQKCRICGSDRYKRTSKGNLIPAKVLTYFPITPRLQRLYATKTVAEEMRWHSRRPRTRGTMAHPSDSEAWTHFDSTYPQFAAETRNVRLALSTNAFTPYGKYGSKYSCWLVILTPYNLPPSMCMKNPFMFLSLIVPGPKNPKGNLDVYIQPLIAELKQLWEAGSLTYDVSKKQNFKMHAAVLWTISDFPTYGMLSGWSTAGKKACPYCMDKSKAFWLENEGKVTWFDCHRHFLPYDHSFRRNKTAFYKNRVVNDIAQPRLTGDEVWHCVSRLPKSIDGLEAVENLKKEKKGWFKQSIFWELPYWKNLLIRHNLDVMDIEKSFFDQLMNTIMDVKGKTSDSANSRRDLKKYCRRGELDLIEDGNGHFSMPKAPYALDHNQKKVLCEWVRDLKFPDGFASNLGRCVDLRTCKLSGMKSHECHVFMERLFPVALKELLPLHIWEAVTEISQFFRDLCSSTIQREDMDRLDKNIAEIICKLEKIFPPSFFNSMEHLPIHLPYEAMVAGPVQYRWRHPFERFLNRLNRKVGNKARIEGSICNAYLMEEMSNFFANCFQPETKSKDMGRNARSEVDNQVDPHLPEIFRADCGTAPTEGHLRFLQDKEYEHAHLHVLANCGILGEYERKFEEYIIQTKPHIAKQDIWAKCESEFPGWFKTHVLRSMFSEDIIHALAMGPSRQVRSWSQFCVNGYNFQTHTYGKDKSTINYGVRVKNEKGLDYGILEDVIELVYLGNLDVYKTVLFKCNWVDLVKGMNVHQQYKLVEVKHTKNCPTSDPFVLSYQVNQVYFAPYPSLKRDKIHWWAVFKTKPRSVIDASMDTDLFQEEKNDDPPSLCPPTDVPDYDDSNSGEEEENTLEDGDEEVEEEDDGEEEEVGDDSDDDDDDYSDDEFGAV